MLKQLFLLLALCAPILAEEGPRGPQPVDFDGPIILNSGATVPIVVFPSSGFLDAAAGMPDESSVIGLFHPNADFNGGVIWITGPYTPSAATLVHEYEHYLECNMPDQGPRLRKLFHDLCTDEFNIGANDLEGDFRDIWANDRAPAPVTEPTPPAPAHETRLPWQK